MIDTDISNVSPTSMYPFESDKINLDFKTGEIDCPTCTTCSVEQDPCVCRGDATECFLGEVCEETYTICKNECTDSVPQKCPEGQKLQEKDDSNLECSADYSCDPDPTPDPDPTTAPTDPPPDPTDDPDSTTSPPTTVTTAPQGCRPESLGECDCSSAGCPGSSRCLIRVSESEVGYLNGVRLGFILDDSNNNRK